MTSQEFEAIERDWTPPAGLARSGPREVRLSGSGILSVGMAILFAATALGVIAQTRYQAAIRERLNAGGRSTQGEVIRTWQIHGKGARNMAECRFSWNGQTFSRSAAVSGEVWKSLSVGSPCAMRFLPDNPAVNFPDFGRNPDIPFPIVLLILVICILAAGFFFYMMRSQRRLLADGRRTPGVVTGLARGAHGRFTVNYQFRLPSGEMVSGRFGPVRPAPAIGDTVCILYRPDRPRESALYPLPAVKLAAR